VRRYAPSAASALLAIALAAIAFGGKGGTELGRATVVELALICVCGIGVGAAVLYTQPGRLYGGATLALFGALAALTALSMLWSVAPDLSWIEAGRTLAYLFVFGAAVFAGRLLPGGWIVLVRALLLAAAAVTAYALIARVFPASLAKDEVYARIGQPFGYWNAVGVTAALALPLALWLGSRREGNQIATALAYPLTGLIALALVLSYSRGALAAALIAAALWFAIVPVRLRSLAVLCVSVVPALPVILWALSQDAFTKDGVALRVREDAASTFGLLLLGMCLLLLAAGFGVRLLAERRPPSAVLRRRVGIAALVVACAVPLAGAVAVATSDRGLGGTISDRLNELTSESSTAPGGPGRLTVASSSRGKYWRQAIDIFDAHQGLGAGAGTFGVARLRYRKDDLVARHAHGYLPQTAADLGLAGLLLSVLLTGAWLIAALRAVGVRPLGGALATRLLRDPRPPPDWSYERAGLTALWLAALAFGLHSFIDWTWFIPGPAVMAFIAAGFVAGRGPFGSQAPAAAPADDARAPAPAPAPPPAAAPAAAPAPAPVAVAGPGSPIAPQGPQSPAASDPPPPTEPPPAVPGQPTPSHARPHLDRGRIALALAVVLAALLCAWATWQPWRSDRVTSHAVDLVANGQAKAAVKEAQHASDIDPLATEPLAVKASAQAAAGQPQAGLRTLQRLVREHPTDPQAWLRLADFQLFQLDRPRDAIETLRAVLFLDPRSRPAQRVFTQAQERLRAPAAPGANGVQ
jgi:O-antigen ligase/polysaccharide polymerase Wzy-like membrane protein/tetratricopeptide repeat protein